MKSVAKHSAAHPSAGTLRTRVWIYAVLAAALIALPWLGSYTQGLATEVLIFAIFAISLDLLIGYTGLLSLGHAAFFGLGAYGVILLGVHEGWNGWAALLGGVAIAAGGAVLIGAFCVRLRGIPFLMLTMAFAQLLYSVAMKWRDLTGGSDGLGGFERPSFWGMPLDDGAVLYYIVLAGFAGVLFMLRRLINSPLGSVLIGIRENERRMEAIGYPVYCYKLIAFIISGTVGGFAGGLYVFFNAFVSPEAVSWHLSGDAVVMVILGGVGTLVGPVIGAALFVLLRNLISGFNEYWLFWLGVLFVACVLFMPQGIWGRLLQVSWRSKR